MGADRGVRRLPLIHRPESGVEDGPGGHRLLGKATRERQKPCLGETDWIVFVSC